MGDGQREQGAERAVHRSASLLTRSTRLLSVGGRGHSGRLKSGGRSCFFTGSQGDLWLVDRDLGSELWPCVLTVQTLFGKRHLAPAGKVKLACAVRKVHSWQKRRFFQGRRQGSVRRSALHRGIPLPPRQRLVGDPASGGHLEGLQTVGLRGLFSRKDRKSSISKLFKPVFACPTLSF